MGLPFSGVLSEIQTSHTNVKAVPSFQSSEVEGLLQEAGERFQGSETAASSQTIRVNFNAEKCSRHLCRPPGES